MCRLGLIAFILTNVEPDGLERVRMKLGVAGVREVYVVQGGLFDLIIKVEGETKESIHSVVETVRKIHGIVATTTLIEA